MNSETKCAGRLRRFAPILMAFAIGSMTWQVHATARDTNHDDVREVVQYGDLNIDSPAGRRTLLRRIEGAVRRVCASTTSNDSGWFSNYHRCKRESLEKALAQIDQRFTAR